MYQLKQKRKSIYLAGITGDTLQVLDMTESVKTWKGKCKSQRIEQKNGKNATLRTLMLTGGSVSCILDIKGKCQLKREICECI